MKFSDRIGVTNSKSSIQIDSMDLDLRNSLWNIYHIFFINPHKDSTTTGLQYYGWAYTYARGLWVNFYKHPIDKLPYAKEDFFALIRKDFFSLQWYEIYNFLDFSCNYLPEHDKENFYKYSNNILTKELSGFRFINGALSPITSETEINEIESALNTTANKLDGVNTHLKTALSKLSDKKNPDYRNSIKESISAIESLCQIITGDKKATLGQALSKIKEKIEIHKALEEGYKKIYGYASDGDGIRHSLLEKSTLDFEDAKYMLVSCSAFVNYLIIKAEKAGIKI